MFAYCGNNPVMYHDATGEFPWAIIGFIAVCAIIGGALGYNSEETLMADAPEGIPSSDKKPKHPSQITEDDLVPPPSTPKGPLTEGDRMMNAALGAALGAAVGGATVSGIGAVAVVTLGAGAALLGGTAIQIVAIGALAYDVVAMVAAPLLGIAMETIELGP